MLCAIELIKIAPVVDLILLVKIVVDIQVTAMAEMMPPRDVVWRVYISECVCVLAREIGKLQSSNSNFSLWSENQITYMTALEQLFSCRYRASTTKNIHVFSTTITHYHTIVTVKERRISYSAKGFDFQYLGIE